jgi:hypothetical protein
MTCSQRMVSGNDIVHQWNVKTGILADSEIGKLPRKEMLPASYRGTCTKSGFTKGSCFHIFIPQYFYIYFTARWR